MLPVLQCIRAPAKYHLCYIKHPQQTLHHAEYLNNPPIIIIQLPPQMHLKEAMFYFAPVYIYLSIFKRTQNVTNGFSWHLLWHIIIQTFLSQVQFWGYSVKRIPPTEPWSEKSTYEKEAFLYEGIMILNSMWAKYSMLAWWNFSGGGMCFTECSCFIMQSSMLVIYTLVSTFSFISISWQSTQITVYYIRLLSLLKSLHTSIFLYYNILHVKLRCSIGKTLSFTLYTLHIQAYFLITTYSM